MDNLEIIQFRPDHVEVASLPEWELNNFKRVNGYEKVKVLNANSLQAITVMREGRIFLMCGFIQLWPGVVELWLIPTIYAQEFPISFCKEIKK